MSDICQRCGEKGEDRRTLWMACLYDMNELGLPFQMKQENLTRPFYTLFVCKSCRADWMQAIKAWFESKPTVDAPGADIPIRILGATRMTTEGQYRKTHPGREPVRLKTEGKT